MAEIQYVALLRGINVGGKNVIRMTDLKACLESMGLKDVATFIQSGNVLFKSTEKDKAGLVNRIERGLSETFHYPSRLVLVTEKELEKIVQGAPPAFGKETSKYTYGVIFLKEPLTPRAALKIVSIKEGVDYVAAGKYALYFSRLIAKASSSRLTRIITMPEYQNMTIRNWNTTVKLLAAMRTSNERKGKDK